MQKTEMIVSIDYDLRSGHPMTPRSFFDAFQALKRRLEELVSCKQVGPCMIAVSPNDKEKAFSAIDLLNDYISSLNIKISFGELSSLDGEFESWQRHNYLEAEPVAGNDQEQYIKAQDIFEMSLEKG